MSSALLTDLYQLTMAQAYWKEGLTEPAVFSLFVRRLPKQRNYLLACGIDTLLEKLHSLRFTDDELDYLASLPQFDAPFIERLRAFRFTGEVRAMRDGTPVFAEEPLLEVTATLPEAQLIETMVLNEVHLQTMLASKAVRVVTAAHGRRVIDFSMRRMHGLETSLAGARAFHVGGVAATSNVAAGRALGIAVAGTMAHSYVQAHETEFDAFRAFVDIYPDAVLLVDTYDTVAGVNNVIALAREMGDAFHVTGIRLDSGDMLALSREARRLLDDAGLENLHIYASGGLDEEEIERFVQADAPIDGFGVGTAMGTAADAPSLDMVYKLAAYAGQPRVKTSPGKRVLPGSKQVVRQDEAGVATGDVIVCSDEQTPGTPLMEVRMRSGELPESLDRSGRQARDRAYADIALLPPELRRLEPLQRPYPVRVSGSLARLHQLAIARTEPMAATKGR